MLDDDVLNLLCTTEQFRIISWVKFFDEYGDLLDDDQRKSYILDMTDSDKGIYPPAKISPSSIDVYV